MSLEEIGEREKMLELEKALSEMGYTRENNCEANKDIERLTYHIFDIPRIINFSVLTPSVIKVLKEYSQYFEGRTGVSAELVKQS